VPLSPPPELRVGIDVVAVERMQRLLGEHEDAASTLFTDRELAYCRTRRRGMEHLAARFAAKEAVLKAFGTGMDRGMRWTDVEVVHAPGGRPAVELHGAVGELAHRRGLGQLEVSLTHSGGLAAAHALLVWQPCAST
jgi:holo-[acyl-carrier protein] synthase